MKNNIKKRQNQVIKRKEKKKTTEKINKNKTKAKETKQKTDQENYDNQSSVLMCV